MAGISSDVDSLRVNRDDFMLGLTEVQPAFGVSEEELQGVIQNGIIHYDDQVEVCPGSYSSALLLRRCPPSQSCNVQDCWWSKFEHRHEHHLFQFCYTVCDLFVGSIIFSNDIRRPTWNRQDGACCNNCRTV